jgi:hypothetical protein
MPSSSFSGADVTANIVIESSEMPVLVGLVAHGLGLAILPGCSSSRPVSRSGDDRSCRPSIRHLRSPETQGLSSG